MSTRKQILVEGSSKPEEHDRVNIEVSVYLEKEMKLSNRSMEFDLGYAQDFDVSPFFDNVVKFMKLHEQAVFVMELAELSNADAKLLNLTANDSGQLSITILLKHIQKLDKVWQLSEHEKVTLAELMKKRGNSLLQSNELARAFRAYKKGIDYLQNSVSVTLSPDSSAHYSPMAVRLLAESLANASLCLLRIACPPETSESTTETERLIAIKDERTRKLLNMCVSYCQKAVALDPTYVKAWFRLGKAYATLCDYENAIHAGEKCIAALKAQQSSPQTTKMLSLTHSQLSTWRASEKKENDRERNMLRMNALNHFTKTDSWPEEDESDGERLPVSVWSNDLAANMMSLHEELEAFGEKMPELRRFSSHSRSTYGRHMATLPALPDDDFEESGGED